MKTIMIVEDNPKNLKLIKLILESNGFSTIVAENGKKCLDLVETSRVDLILMDIQMPELDGIECLKCIRGNEATRAIPVIATTAFAMKGDKERFLGLGFDGYISKPIRIEPFLEKINETLKIS